MSAVFLFQQIRRWKTDQKDSCVNYRFSAQHKNNTWIKEIETNCTPYEKTERRETMLELGRYFSFKKLLTLTMKFYFILFLVLGWCCELFSGLFFWTVLCIIKHKMIRRQSIVKSNRFDHSEQLLSSESILISLLCPSGFEVSKNGFFQCQIVSAKMSLPWNKFFMKKHQTPNHFSF